MLKNQQAFVVGITGRDKKSYLDYAYQLERIVLELTKIGIGTCWLGGHFRGKKLLKWSNILDDPKQIIPAVSSLGYKSDKQRFYEPLMIKMTKMHKRKEWDEIFFYESFNTPLTDQTVGDLKTVFKMVRMAPSARNNQPWRLLLKNNSIHFYIYAIKEERTTQSLDIGIAMYHLESSLSESGKAGKFTINEPKTDRPNGYYYSCSFEMD